MKRIGQLARKIWNEFSYPWSMAWGYFKGYRYIRFIIILIVLILVLAVLAQNTQDTNDLARWACTFFSEWAMVLSAAATLLLAGAAFWAIMDNRYGRIVDRKERLLNEIIEWAIDIHHCTNPILRPGENEMLIRYNILTNLIDMAATDEYIRKVSKIEFSDPLIKEVDELTNKAFLYGCVLKLSLDSKPELSEEWRKAFIESVAKEKLDAIDKVIKQGQGLEAWSKIIDEYQVLVRGLAQKVISSCAEIKTKLLR